MGCWGVWRLKGAVEGGIENRGGMLPPVLTINWARLNK